MAVSHRRWAQSYAPVELCVNFVNRLYLGEIILSSVLLRPLWMGMRKPAVARGALQFFNNSHNACTSSSLNNPTG